MGGWVGGWFTFGYGGVLRGETSGKGRGLSFCCCERCPCPFEFVLEEKSAAFVDTKLLFPFLLFLFLFLGGGGRGGRRDDRGWGSGGD